MPRINEIKTSFESLQKELESVLDGLDDYNHHSGAEGESVRKPGCAAIVAEIGAVIEQAFNAISANFWDEPVEWTSNGALNSKESLLDYLNEVARLRVRVMDGLSDGDLKKVLYDPDFKPISIEELLDRALGNARRKCELLFEQTREAGKGADRSR